MSQLRILKTTQHYVSYVESPKVNGIICHFMKSSLLAQKIPIPIWVIIAQLEDQVLNILKSIFHRKCKKVKWTSLFFVATTKIKQFLLDDPCEKNHLWSFFSLKKTLSYILGALSLSDTVCFNWATSVCMCHISRWPNTSTNQSIQGGDKTSELLQCINPEAYNWIRFKQIFRQ